MHQARGRFSGSGGCGRSSARNSSPTWSTSPSPRPAVFSKNSGAAEDFEPLHEPECNIVAFRHLPESLRGASDDEIGAHQLKLRRRVVESGAFYIVSTQIDGIGALRAVVMNPLTGEDDLDALLETLRAQAQA